MGRRVLLAVGLAAALMAASAPGARAATDFYSSFESGDPAPTWESTAEVDSHGNKKMSGVTGSSSPGIPGNIRDKVVAVTASAENPPAETAERLNDGDVNSKWLAFEPTGWVRYQLSEPVTVVDYALSSANDSAERDPRDWELQGSHDGSAWTTVDTQTGQDFSERFQTKQYDVATPGSYEYYRLNITANHGDGLVQLAELQLSDGDTTPPPATDMKAFATSGPVNGADDEAERRLDRRQGAALLGRSHRRRPWLRLRQGVRRRPQGHAEQRAVVPDLPRAHQQRPRLPEHVRGRRPRLHRRHLPVRPPRARPARRTTSTRRARARASRCTPTSGTARSPTSARSPPARRSIASSSATTTRKARTSSTAGSTTSASTAARRRRPTRGRPTGCSPPAGPTRPAASRAATTSRPRPSRTASISGRR